MPNLTEKSNLSKEEIDVNDLPSHNYSMKLFSLVILSLILCNLSFASQTAPLYTIDDLRALNQQQEYPELLDHAYDVLPAKRDVLWRNLVESAALGYVKKIYETKTNTPQTFKRLKMISSWPILAKNEFYISYQDKFLIDQIRLCSKSHDLSCISMSKRFIKDFKHEKSFVFEIALGLTNSSLYEATQWEIIKEKLTSEISTFYCHKKHIKDVLLNNLSEFSKVSSKRVHPDCISKIKNDINTKIISKQTKMEEKIALSMVLKKYDLLTPQASALISIESFLTNDNLDKQRLESSLAEFKKISKNITYREEILDILKDYDPLPDRIFAISSKATIAKINIISKNFPELIDLYATKCLNYLDGTKEFIAGNPTPNCHSFFRMSKNKQILPESFIRRYENSTKFYKAQ